jgi:hypothetical protein
MMNKEIPAGISIVFGAGIKDEFFDKGYKM